MINEKNVLWISLNAPYDKVDHAGGQVHNYYLKKLHRSGKFNIKLISFCHPSEIDKLDLDDYGIDATIFPQENKGIKHILWGIMHLETRYNPWNRYAGITYNFFEVKLRQEIKKLICEGYKPDIVILQWTQMVLFIHYLKKCFPNAKFICIEEDVTFLGIQRFTELKPTWSNKKRYKTIKRIEIDALNTADYIICSNKKDMRLLDHENIKTPRWSWCPYFYNMRNVVRKNRNHDILFFGAMSREANWKSAIWFIEKVFQKIKDQSIRFVILGSKPPQELIKYKSNRILITGFVDNVEPYFQDSMCMVVPLQLGAGIKIKTLEGLSSGIPVLANSIGIEGIPAEHMQEYLRCESPDDFLNALNFVLQNEDKAKQIGENGKAFVNRNFNFEKDTARFIDLVSRL